ncbi:MAG: Electron transport complex subunit RsxB [Candidatus Dichloromethanomonas elyunquensis]|nr:MAG: Electron transport complex subunit RsxB [Candidatus Dichloromethanomonas elyunquensis]
MVIVIAIIGVMALVGLFFGLVLAFANKKLAVEMNPLIHVVEDVLPKGQCGACGYAGCQAYAEAVVLDKDVSPSLCIPGKKAVSEQVAKLTGKAAAEIEPQYAFIKCCQPAVGNNKYDYSGINDCLAATLCQGGPKECKYGCIGLGTCVKQCVFDALQINENGLPEVDEEKCTGCGKCATACPKKVIAMIPAGSHVSVHCNSLDTGAVVRKICKVGCIGCGVCVKQCPYSAIIMKDNLAVIDSSICMDKCDNSVCLEKCPSKVIRTYKISLPEIKNAV